MKPHTKMFAAALVAAVALAGAGLSAQDQRPPVVPAKVDVVITRYQAEKKVSSLPYSLMVNLNRSGATSLRMGVDVPIGTTSRTNDGVTTTQTTFRNVGTSIDCRGETRPDGRFELFVNVSDSSIATESRAGGAPVRLDPLTIQTFTTSNNLTLRENVPMEFIAATDKVTGEVVKISVTLTVIK